MPELSQSQKEELACVYAALILHDEGIAVTADKINAIVKAAGVTVQPYWPSFFERVLKANNVEALLSNVGAGGGGAPAAGGAPAKGGDEGGKKGGDKGGDKGGKKEEKKEEKKKPEPEPEADEGGDMGLSLFD